MSATIPGFALIGRSYPSETYETLHRAFSGVRRPRKDVRGEDGYRRWHPSAPPLILPKQLSA